MLLRSRLPFPTRAPPCTRANTLVRRPRFVYARARLAFCAPYHRGFLPLFIWEAYGLPCVALTIILTMETIELMTCILVLGIVGYPFTQMLLFLGVAFATQTPTKEGTAETETSLLHSDKQMIYSLNRLSYHTLHHSCLSNLPQTKHAKLLIWCMSS